MLKWQICAVCAWHLWPLPTFYWLRLINETVRWCVDVALLRQIKGFLEVSIIFLCSQRSHLQDLKDVTHNIHYETYRVRRLNESNMNCSGVGLPTWLQEVGTTDKNESESHLWSSRFLHPPVQKWCSSSSNQNEKLGKKDTVFYFLHEMSWRKNFNFLLFWTH